MLLREETNVKWLIWIRGKAYQEGDKQSVTPTNKELSWGERWKNKPLFGSVKRGDHQEEAEKTSFFLEDPPGYGHKEIKYQEKTKSKWWQRRWSRIGKKI